MSFISKIKFHKKHTIQILPGIIVLVTSTFLFHHIYFDSDIHDHSGFAGKFINGTANLPGNFFYYWLISFFAGFNTSYLHLSSILVLGFSVLLKYTLVYSLLRKWTPQENISYKTISAISLALIVLSSIYLPQLIFHRVYLGSFTPNIWHNSTTIAVFPFAILLFTESVKQINRFSKGRIYLILLLVIINAIIKPSFLFVYVGALPLVVWFVHPKISPSLYFKQIFPAVFALSLVFIQKYLIFNSESVYKSDASIVIDPFYVFNSWHSGLSYFQNLILFAGSVVSSLLYPVFVFSRIKITRQNTDILFSIVSMIGALLIFILFKETGSRMLHGNFLWQTFICSFILFLVAVKHSIVALSEPILKNKKPNLYKIIFTMHVIFGLLYIVKLVAFKSYA